MVTILYFIYALIEVHRLKIVKLHNNIIHNDIILTTIMHYRLVVVID